MTAGAPRVPLGRGVARSSSGSADRAEVVDLGGRHREDGAAPLPISAVDVQFDPDDPSDAVLVVTLADGTAEYPLTEMKAARLLNMLTNQQDEVRRARNLIMGNVDASDTDAARGATSQTSSAARTDVEVPDLDGDDPPAAPDDDEPDDDEQDSTTHRLSRRAVDPLSFDVVTPLVLDNIPDVNGRPAKEIWGWIVAAILVVSAVVVVAGFL